MAKTLAVVGGGPKAAAIVARAAVLRELLGADRVPEILVFEKRAVGSAWSGDGGFSSGYLTLCSPAEKDIGFPYADILARGFPEPLAPKLFARFSWSAFLVAGGGFAEWVDRGRDYPSHRRWADYLGWVFAEADQGIVEGEVSALIPQPNGGWHIRYEHDGRVDTTFADGVVLTGTGRARAIPFAGTPLPEGRYFDAETFWDARDQVLKFGEIAVAGAGGAAGAIIAWLSSRLAEREKVTIASISPLGTLFPRGDGYNERRWFSDPTDWRRLTLDDRRRVIERTEGGVISARNKSIIDGAQNIAFIHGYAERLSWDDDEVVVDLLYNRRPAPPRRVDCVINAIGFDPWTLLQSVEASAVTGILRESEAKLRESIAEAMLPDLSFDPQAGLGVGLHVPTLASLARGPGLGTLGCLGLAASSVLDGYLE